MNKDIERLSSIRLLRHKKRNIWVSAVIALAIVVLCVSVYKLIQPASAAFRDLTPYITSVEEKGDITYDPVHDYYVGDSLEIKYKLPSGVLTESELEYSYTYPAGIKIDESLLNQDKSLYDSNNTKAGTYKFVNDNGRYAVRISFSEAYAKNVKGSEVSGFVRFASIYNKSLITNKDQVVINFSDKIAITIPPQKIKNNYDIKTVKDGYYDASSNALKYTVLVYSLNGTPDVIDYQDVLNKNGLTFTSLNVGVEKVDIDYRGEYDYSVSNPQPISVSDLRTDANNATIAMTLPKLDSRSGYRVTYTYTLGNLAKGTNLQVDNTVRVSSEKKETGDKVNDSSSKSIYVGRDYSVEKSGKIQNGVATWNVFIKNNYFDLAGTEVKDDMFAQLTPADIHIYPNSGYIINKDNKGHISSIVFQSIDGKPNTNSYTITYDTKTDQSKVDNTVTVDGKPTTATAKEENQSQTSEKDGVKVYKTMDGSQIANDYQSVAINWSVAINIPENTKISQYQYGQDYLGAYGNNSYKHYYTYEQIADVIYQLKSSAIGEAIDEFKVTKSDGNEVEWNENDENLKQCTFTKFSFKFAKDYITSKNETIILHYSTIGDMSSMTDQTKTYTNTFDMLGSGSAYCEITTGTFVKTDKDGKKETTYQINDDGTLSWKLIGYPDPNEEYEEIVVTDNIPDGLTLESLDIDYGGHTGHIDMSGLTNFDSSEFDDWTYLGHYNVLLEGQKLTIHIYPDKDHKFKWTNNSDRHYCKFETIINCKVDKKQIPNYKKGLYYEFKNYATFFYGKRQIEGTQTQWWKEDYKVIGKTGEWDSSAQRLKYEVKVNPDGDDLLPGEDNLHFEDVLAYSTGGINRAALLDRSSVKFIKVNKDKTEEDITEQIQWQYSATLNGSDCTSTISAVIPDETSIIVRYEYVVSGDFKDGYNLGFKNTASLTGTVYADIDSKEEYKWSKATSSAGVEAECYYQFYKVEEGNYGKALEGAEFTVYIESSNSNQANLEVKRYTTDKYGTFVIRGNDLNVNPDGAVQLYYVVETRAPEGYKIPEVAPKYYFYFDKNDTYVAPEGISAVNLAKTSAMKYVTNSVLPTEIEVEKIWFDGDGKQTTDTNVDEIYVDLHRIDTYTKLDEIINQNVVISKNTNWKYTFKDLEQYSYHTDSNGVTKSYPYKYYVVERNVKGYEWVVVDDNKESLLGVSKDTAITSGKVTLKNYAINYKMPETGGPGRSVLMACLGVIFVLIAFVGILYKKNKGKLL